MAGARMLLPCELAGRNPGEVAEFAYEVRLVEVAGILCDRRQPGRRAARQETQCVLEADDACK